MPLETLDANEFKVNVISHLIPDSEPGYRDCPGQFTFWAYGTHFEATITLPKTVETDSVWSIGFIQGVTAASAMHLYGDHGLLRRDVHPLLSGLHHCVNDGDGSAMPFFDNQSSRVEIQPGIVPTNSWHIEYSDWPYSSVENTSPSLTRVERTCSYLVWLVAIKWSQRRLGDNPTLSGNFRPDEDEVAVFCTFSWRSVINCCLNPTLPVGSRVKQFAYDLQEDPTEIRDCPLSLSVMVPPTYASSISSVWVPFSGHDQEAFLCQFPKEIIVDWKTWVDLMIPPSANFMYEEDDLKTVKQIENCGIDPVIQTIEISRAILKANVRIKIGCQLQRNNCNKENRNSRYASIQKKQKKQIPDETMNFCSSTAGNCELNTVYLNEMALINRTKDGSILNVALRGKPIANTNTTRTPRSDDKPPMVPKRGNKNHSNSLTDRLKNSGGEKTYTLTLNFNQQKRLQNGNVLYNVLLSEKDSFSCYPEERNQNIKQQRHISHETYSTSSKYPWRSMRSREFKSVYLNSECFLTQGTRSCVRRS